MYTYSEISSFFILTKYQRKKQKKMKIKKLRISMNVFIVISAYIDVTGGGILDFSRFIVLLSRVIGILHTP